MSTFNLTQCKIIKLRDKGLKGCARNLGKSDNEIESFQTNCQIKIQKGEMIMFALYSGKNKKRPVAYVLAQLSKDKKAIAILSIYADVIPAGYKANDLRKIAIEKMNLVPFNYVFIAFSIKNVEMAEWLSTNGYVVCGTDAGKQSENTVFLKTMTSKKNEEEILKYANTLYKEFQCIPKL